MDEAKKFDSDKMRWDLLPWLSIEAVAAILTFGAKKYGDRNWEKGLKDDRLFAAAMRHLMARKKGELVDPESGLPHIAHACCNLLMMAHFELKEQHETSVSAQISKAVKGGPPPSVPSTLVSPAEGGRECPWGGSCDPTRCGCSTGGQVHSRPVPVNAAPKREAPRWDDCPY